MKQVAADRIADAVKDLIRRGNSRPRTVKTLTSKLHALFQKQIGEPEIASLIQALARAKHIAIAGTKVTYTLKPAK